MDKYLIRSWYLLIKTAEAVNFLGKETVDLDYDKPFGRSVLEVAEELKIINKERE